MFQGREKIQVLIKAKAQSCSSCLTGIMIDSDSVILGWGSDKCLELPEDWVDVLDAMLRKLEKKKKDS